MTGRVLACLVALETLAFADPRTGDHTVDRAHRSMGTEMHITVWGHDDEQMVAAIDAAFAEFDRLDRMMTTWTADGEMTRVNEAAGNGKPVKVSSETMTVLVKARDLSRLTGGAFDITVGSFWGLWKFDEDRDGSIPDAAAVAERKQLIDWRDVILDPKRRTVRLRRAGQRITLGGIAKGYAVDRAVAILRKRGLVDFIVQGGGDLYAAGKKGDRRWRVGIRDPRGARTEFFALADVEDQTFSTSGDYERFVVKDGRRYHHIIDPRTGYPATASRSVTVMGKDAFTSDGILKALFILGADEGKPLADKLGLAVVWVTGDNKVVLSKAAEGKVTLLREPTPGI
jgi:thiamine biosynthesis lipoprotein